MVELAIMLPLLLLLVFGIIEFGRGYNTQITLTHAAREAAREYSISQDALAGQTAAVNAASTLDSSLMTISLSACNPGEPAVVRITYPFQMFIPFFPSTPIQLAAEGVMRCGG